MTTRRGNQTKTMSAEQVQRVRQARVYESMARLCKLGAGIESMSISAGGKTVTIDRENSGRMVRNAKAIAAALRSKGTR